MKRILVFLLASILLILAGCSTQYIESPGSSFDPASLRNKGVAVWWISPILLHMEVTPLDTNGKVFKCIPDKDSFIIAVLPAGTYRVLYPWNHSGSKDDLTFSVRPNQIILIGGLVQEGFSGVVSLGAPGQQATMRNMTLQLSVHDISDKKNLETLENAYPWMKGRIVMQTPNIIGSR
jgi:hypothetical protein